MEKERVESMVVVWRPSVVVLEPKGRMVVVVWCEFVLYILYQDGEKWVHYFFFFCSRVLELGVKVGMKVCVMVEDREGRRR